MGIYVGLGNDDNSKHTKTLNMKWNEPPKRNCDFSFGSASPLSVPLPGCVTKNTQTKFHIQTDSSQPQNIGFHVNTNLHFKPKTRLNYKDIINAVLLCLLVGHAVWSNFEAQKLKAELKTIRKNVYVLGETLNSISASVEKLEEKLKQIEDTSVHKEDGHMVIKREIEPQIGISNSTITNRQARSVSRGAFAIHLRGALPEISVRDGGIIAPWYIDKPSSGIFLLADGVVGEGKGIVEIVEEGLYFIYAQMYYMTSSSLNSYAINLQLGDGKGREDMVVAVCSAEAATNKLSELSCFTAVVRYLHRGDRIYVTQRERNRRIIFRDNKSFLGLTLLNSPHGFIQ